MKNILNTIKKDFVLIIGNYFQQIASIIFGILVAKKITPEAYGIFGLAILLTTYLKFLNLGGQFSINKRLSIRSDSWVSYNYLNFNIFIFPILSGIGLYFLFYFNLIPELNVYYVYIWLFLIFDNAFQLIQGVIRARGLSKLLGNSRIITGIIIFVMVFVFLNWEFKNDPLPLFVKLLVIPFIGVVYFICLPDARSFLFFPKIKTYKYFKFFLFEGIVLGVYVFLQDFLESIDRFFIATNFSTYDLGIYSFAASIASPILLVLTTVMYMDYSREMRLFKGLSFKDFQTLKMQMLKKFFFLYIGFTILGIIAVLGLLNFYLIEYKASFIVLVVLLLSYIPSILSYPYSLYFIANGLRNSIIQIIAMGVVISGIFDFIVIVSGLDYIYIIVATFFSKLLIYVFFSFKFKKIIHA